MLEMAAAAAAARLSPQQQAGWVARQAMCSAGRVGDVKSSGSAGLRSSSPDGHQEVMEHHTLAIGGDVHLRGRAVGEAYGWQVRPSTQRMQSTALPTGSVPPSSQLLVGCPLFRSDFTAPSKGAVPLPASHPSPATQPALPSPLSPPHIKLYELAVVKSRLLERQQRVLPHSMAAHLAGT